MVHFCYLATKRVRLRQEDHKFVASLGYIVRLLFFFLYINKLYLQGSRNLIKRAKSHVINQLLELLPVFLLLCWRGITSSRSCRVRGSRNSHSPTSRHTGKFTNTLASDILNDLPIQLTDDLVEPVITCLDAHDV